MRLQSALICLVVVAGCQSQRNYTGTCPNCNQSPGMVMNPAPVAPAVSPVTYVDAEEPAPMPKNYAAAFDPVPSVPGVED